MKNEELFQEIIEALNKKGYEVKTSSLEPFIENTLIKEKCPKKDYPHEEFMNWLNEHNLKLLDEDKDYYYYESKVLGKKSYLQFADKHAFATIPEGFEYEDEENKLSYAISFYKDDKYFIQKTKDEFESETRKYLDNLKGWLDDLNERQEKMAKSKKESNELKELQIQLEEEKGKSLRVQAEMMNFKKRKEDELSNMLKYANEDIVISLLPVIDNFERAINLDDNDLTDELSRFLSGFKMIYSSLITILNENEVKEIEASGVEFNPNFHQAVITEKDENKPSGVILEVLQKGYTLKGKVIRPAMVKVNE